MKQYKDQLTGTGKVFSFTYTQFFKNKGNIISMVFLLIMALASVPVMTLVGGGSAKQPEATEIQTIYIQNHTDIPISNDLANEIVRADSYFQNVTLVLSDVPQTMGAYDVTVDFSVTEAEDVSMLDEYFININTEAATELSDSDLGYLQTCMSDLFDTARLKALNITNEQMAVLMSEWNISTEKLSEYLNPEDEDRWSTQYFVQLAYSIIVMMVSIFSVSYIVTAIVQEKSSKLVELLMVSVKPLALIVGKILAALLYVITLFGMLIAGYIISYHVTGMFLDVSASGNLLTQMGISTDLLNAGPFLILAIIFSLLLGFLTFAIIAGLSATGCSTTEDSQSAMSASTFLIMAGYMGAVFASSADIAIVNQIVSLVPVVSLYCAPINYVMGNIGLATLFISWVLQIIVIIMLAVFCSRIYTNLLMYRGNRVKFTQMLSMAKQPRVGKEKQ